MELGKRIKQYRSELNMNQDALAERMYVSRQTISNWENGKSYPDVHSLILLGEIFDVSLDTLIKGDVEIMKEIINEKDIKNFDFYGKIYTLHLVITILAAAPLMIGLKAAGYVIFAILVIITMYWALKVEKVKKENDIQSYREIVEFMKGRKLEKEDKIAEVAKRPYQKVMLVMLSAVIAAVVCIVMAFLMMKIG